MSCRGLVSSPARQAAPLTRRARHRPGLSYRKDPGGCLCCPEVGAVEDWRWGEDTGGSWVRRIPGGGEDPAWPVAPLPAPPPPGARVHPAPSRLSLLCLFFQGLGLRQHHLPVDADTFPPALHCAEEAARGHVGRCGAALRRSGHGEGEHWLGGGGGDGGAPSGAGSAALRARPLLHPSHPHPQRPGVSRPGCHGAEPCGDGPGSRQDGGGSLNTGKSPGGSGGTSRAQ